MIPKATLNNGLEMPFIGLGVFRMEDNENSEHAILEALRIGYRHIDTAAYYKNEETVKKAIQKSGIPREEIFITTKLWNDEQRSGKVTEALEESLRKLGTTYIDLYLIHWPVPEKFLQTWKIFEEIYKSGKSKAVGVSNFKVYHLETLQQESDLIPAVNQIECHPYLNQEETIAYCMENNIRPEAWSPFAANQTGLLEEKLLNAIGEAHNKTAAQIILRWDFQRGVVTIPKSSNPKRLQENIDIFDFELTGKEMELIGSLNKNKRIGPDPDHVTF